MKRNDLSTLLPWTAEAERPDDNSSPWCVVAPRRYARDKQQLIASLLSEEDAKTIALAHPAIDLVWRILEGASRDELEQTAQAIARQYHQKCVRCCLCGESLVEEDAFEWNGDKAHDICIQGFEARP